MNKKTAVIFDMDGVIFDSERVLLDCWKDLEKIYGFSGIEVPFRQSIGGSEARTRKLVLDHYGPDFPYEKYRKEVSLLYHSRWDHGKLPQKPGIRELLGFLKAQKIRTAVASSTRMEVVENQIADAGLMPFFDVVFGGDTVKNGKPDPEIFLKAAAALNAAPEDCIVIEDSYNGIRAASAGGMFPIMVPDLLPPDEEMREKAGFVAEDLLEVLDWFSDRLRME